MINRFYVAQGEELLDVISELQEKGYLQLPDAGRKLDKVIIDTHLKTFWMLDQTCFENNVSIIRFNYNETIKVLGDNDIKKI